MQLNITNLSRAALLSLLLTGMAAAGPLALETDGTTGLPGWHGTQTTWISALKIQATVEYAVYAPGMFDQSALLGNPVDPSFDSNYVYAYEVSAPTAPLQYLSVSTVPGAIPLSYVGSGQVDNWTSPNLGQAPNAEIFNAGVSVVNARWTFNSPLLPATTGFSNILFFTSPFGPQWNNAAISGGGSQINTTSLPSPVPEPATLTLAAIALVFLLAVGRRRRQAA